MKKVSWKEAKLAHLRFFYGRLAVAWEGESDDRGLFSNTYKMIVNAVSSLPENPDNYVRCAMNRAIRADLEMMDRIAVHVTQKQRFSVAITTDSYKKLINNTLQDPACFPCHWEEDEK